MRTNQERAHACYEPDSGVDTSVFIHLSPFFWVTGVRVAVRISNTLAYGRGKSLSEEQSNQRYLFAVFGRLHYATVVDV